ncbi:MAG: PAC2 family protein [Propioniciclava sp.]
MAVSELSDLRRPVALASFSGWNDAGDAATGVLDHLTDIATTKLVYSLDPDDYYDFTENRPVLVRSEPDAERRLQWATTEILVAALPERDLVLINGPEPNLRWRAFANALVSALRTAQPERVITMGAMLADVPHSRPTPVAENGTDYEGPSGVVGVLTSACKTADFEVSSLWASVPHYVADPPNPKATLALLRRVEDLLDVSVDLKDLPQQADVWESRVAELVAEDPDILTYVGELEEHYDNAETTGEEIALQFERYLRRRER